MKIHIPTQIRVFFENKKFGYHLINPGNKICEIYFFIIQLQYMMSNFYFPWQIPYSQTSLQEFWFNYWMYPELCQVHQPNYSAFSQISYLETSLGQNKSEDISEKQMGQQKKHLSQSDFHQESIDQIDCQNERDVMDDAKTRQKYGRNITSNIFRSLLKRISSPNRFKKLFHQITLQKNLTISYEKFLEQIDRLSDKLRSYVKRNQMRRFIVPEHHQRIREEFCLIFRILAKIYLKQQHTVSIFYSKKINRQSRKIHFIIVRQMESLLK